MLPAEFPGIARNRSMPGGVVIPVLYYPSAVDAARWLCEAFGFSERLRIGGHRVQIDIGGAAGAVVAAMRPDAYPAAENSGHSLMVRIDDVDAHCARAQSRGARILAAPADYPYGERQYSVADCGGHAWTFSQTLADIDPASWGGVEPPF
ncbi:MAG: glyoxalase [Hydrocarboniphaga sp.]|uniref:VOC family protein n=1 Tax=Hydrocarboniphaga sp. TaxID=2033016 RepID=UPI00261AF1AA|nr:VOC family protein [Hydrocarboniphaga sp.]MDB5970845.1 glyoxalase [Hydrocarboniphaga sp.]